VQRDRSGGGVKGIGKRQRTRWAKAIGSCAERVREVAQVNKSGAREGELQVEGWCYRDLSEMRDFMNNDNGHLILVRAS
jgi:hypothetical protein